VARGMLLAVCGQVVDDARLGALDHPLERRPAQVGGVALGQEERLVRRPRVLGDHPLAALVDEGEADAVAGDDAARVLEQEVGDVVERLLGRHLLVDHPQRGPLLGADPAPRAAVVERIEEAERRLQTHPSPPVPLCIDATTT